jgi:putative sterol carrier protein
VYAWLDLHDGGCRGTQVLEDLAERDHGFVITGAYGQWRGLVAGEDDVVNLIVSAEMDLEGDMGTLMQNAAAATDMVDVAAGLETRFLF